MLRSKAKEPLGGLEESHACVSIPTDLETRFPYEEWVVGHENSERGHLTGPAFPRVRSCLQ